MSDNNFGVRIAQAIKESPFSAKEIAVKMEITPQAISRAIHQNSLSKKNLRKIAEITNVNEEWLMKGTEAPARKLDAQLMAKCISAVQKAAKELGMVGLDEVKVTHAALLLYEANL